MSDPTLDATRLYAVLLAAGAARRFGALKQLAPVAGRPMLLGVLERVIAVVGSERVSVVLGAGADELRALVLRAGATVVLNEAHAAGISSSIRAGVAQLPRQADAVLIALADQPVVSIEDLRQLVMQWRGDPRRAVAAEYASTVGPPVIFPADWFGELAALEGDRGAKALLARNPDRVLTVPMPSAALDVDTPADLKRL